MDFYENTLQYFLFRVLNAPFYVTGYSSLVTLLSIMTSLWTCGWLLEDSVQNPNGKFTRMEYDFIVVGAGSAGAVIANRLSASGDYNVLLMEAGGDPTPYNSIPALAPFNLHLSTDWHYRTEPQKNSCLLVDEQKMHWPKSRMLGGCSELNFMVYMRGNPRDYDNWASLSGDDQWKYENVLPYFKKSENYKGNWPNPEFHGTDGLLTVSKKTYQPSVDYWVAAGGELGFDTTTDPNSYQKPGFYKMDTTINNGKRSGTYNAFIKPFLYRSNFHVLRYAHVIKINFDDQLRAVGVTYVRDGAVLTVAASKEVIISTGVIGAPQLLMLSGIGPEKHLIEHGITPLVNSPGVGQNLQDHVLVTLGPFLLNAPISFLFERDFTFNSILEYEVNRTGPISSNIVSGIGLFSTAGADPNWPNIMLHMADLGVRHGASEDLVITFGLKPSAYLEYLAPYTKLDANFVLINLSRPKSTGVVELKSSDPFMHPKIDPRYFSDPNDMTSMVEALQFTVKIFENTEAYQSVGAKLADKKLPECDHLPTKSDAYFECYIRHLTSTIYHPCCTVRFGHESDPMAVLDSHLRVKGVKGLRVADASVMPKIPNANINAPTIMIGEKAADMILAAWEGTK